MGGILRHLLGWFSLALGIVGLALPILQGWLLIAIGALLLAPDVPFFARLVAWIERRAPVLREPLQRWRERFGQHRRGDGDP